MLLIKNGTVYINNKLKQMDIAIVDDKIQSVNSSIKDEHAEVIDATGCLVMPGLQDAHVHLREPGFEYKETIKEGTLSAARGGYTFVCPMPNLNPVPDSLEHLNLELELIKRDALITTLPYASITKGEAGQELSAFEDVAPYIIGYSDDGRGVNDEALLKEAMIKATKLGKPVVLHCEDLSLVNGGYVADTPYLLGKGYKGICAASESEPIKTAIRLAGETDAHVHICHISCRESIEAIREGKAAGIHVTCEVTPHHLLMNDLDITSDDGNFKMNPPIRSKEDQEDLIQALNDGTIDLIATDNAPHSLEEKKRGLEKSPFGIICNEYAFALLYTNLVKTGKVKLETLIKKMTSAKDVLMNKETIIEANEVADLCIMKLDVNETIKELHSKSQNSPFVGWKVESENLYTIHHGKIVYAKEN